MTKEIENQAFSNALNFVLRWEGGYVNHPSDKGGETNYGVTSAVYIQYRKSKGLPPRSVRLISAVEVRDIYQKNYWLAAGCDLLPARLALCQFDWAVNAGTYRAIKALQQVVNTEPDGIIGPATTSAVATAIQTRGESSLVNNYLAVREGCYRRWGVGNQEVFLKGWLNRLSSLRAEVA